MELARHAPGQLPELADRPAERRPPEHRLPVFNGFATFLDDIVGWLDQLFHWLTWVGTTVAGVAVVLRFGGVKAAAWVLGAFFSFAFLRALGREHPDALADARGGLALAARRDSAGRPRGPVATLRPRDHAGARRDADHPRLRVSDAGRDPLLGRPRRGRDHDDDLRGPAGDPDHGARDPRGADEHGRGGGAMGSTRLRSSARCSSRSRGG